MNQSRITAVRPGAAVAGGRISVLGNGFRIDGTQLPEVRIGDRVARTVFASATRIDVLVPLDLPHGGALAVTVDGATDARAIVNVALPLVTNLHQVDSPACDSFGNVYVTYSGRRGQETPVSVFRITPAGVREAFSQGIVNATSLAVDASDRLYVSSRFEGVVYRLDSGGVASPFATDLGVACGLAFASDGTLFVGDRSGTIFKVDQRGRATAFAVLPASVAAFHLALDEHEVLHVTGPTLATHDAVYRIDSDGGVSIQSRAFGRPQGLAVDGAGTLFVVEALAGSSGVYRLNDSPDPELVVSGPDLVGLAFDRGGGMVVCSADSVYRFPLSR